MQITVEFFSTARELTGAKQVQLELAVGSTLRDVVVALADKCPKLVGPIIDVGSTSLVGPYLFNVEGRHTVPDLSHRPEDGQRIILLLALAGG
jgi:molybdopterin converting factor small subunit